MPRSQAEARWAFANQAKDPYAKEVVNKLHEEGPGSVKALPERAGGGVKGYFSARKKASSPKQKKG